MKNSKKDPKYLLDQLAIDPRQKKKPLPAVMVEENSRFLIL